MKKLRANFALAPEVHNALRELAQEQGLSMSSALTLLIKEKTDKLEK